MENLEILQNVLKLEAECLNLAATRINAGDADLALNILTELRRVEGSLVFCGVGKSGLIGEKLASTFTSLGLPSFMLHPVEALHGDLGRVSSKDVIVFLSKSGTTEEIMKLMPFLPVSKERRIGLLGNTKSVIAEECALNLDCSVEKEACLNNQAPTTSSTLALAMGDALAVLWEKLVGLSKESFAVNHPGGLLGKSLIIKVKDLMCAHNECATVDDSATLQDVILEMTKFPVGGCAIIDKDNTFKGILVEGDIRRTFTKESGGLDSKVTEILNSKPVSISRDDLALDALKLMEDRERQIDVLPVLDGDKFLGFIRLHDLLREGFHLNG
jgi:arabinose-5-phosphate isomerase